MSLYAVKRPGEQIAIMVLAVACDPREEAIKGGPVESIVEITEQEAEAIRAIRPVAEVLAPAGYVTRDEMQAAVNAASSAAASKAVAEFAASIAKATGGT